MEFSTQQNQALSENAVRFISSYKVHMRKVAELIRSKMHDGSRVQSVVSSPDDLTAQLEKLAELKAQGALSDEEFARAKAKLIGA